MQFINMSMSALVQGLCYALVAMGVYISYKILDFPDLTVDGTFPLGGVVSVMLIKAGLNPILAIMAALLCGGFAGFITGFLHVKFKISNLLSGILVMTGLISINLNLGKVDGNIKVLISYLNEDATLFNGKFMSVIFGTANRTLGKIIILIFIVILFKLILDWFLKTKAGFMLRAAGNNEQLVTNMGKSVGFYKILGLAIANAMVALAGAVYSQQMNYYDNTSGIGMVVIGLASVIIGCSIFKNAKVVKGTTSVIIGAIIYSACLSIAVNIGIDSTYLKLVMAVIFTIVLIINKYVEKNNGKSLKDLLKRRQYATKSK
jgi:putative ABC transport system permease protein